MQLLKLIIILPFFLICAILACKIVDFHQREDSYTRVLDFPFKIISEQHIDGIRQEQQASILMDEIFFSKKNLDSLFLWYLAKFPNNEIILNVQVATDRSHLKSNQANGIVDVVPGKEKSGVNISKTYHKAFFTREVYKIAGAQRLNAWYYFNPNFDAPNVMTYVVLKGKDPHALRLPLEDQEVLAGTLKLKFSSYTLRNTEPAGTYYTFEFAKLNIDGWNELFTVRFDKNIPIPQNQIRFIDSQIAYTYVGWVFAVTVNGGNRWKIWDAEDDLASWMCCDASLIDSVKLEADGTGTMQLKLNHQQAGSLLVLRTKDFGQHWETK